jgi:hypothetical protein
MNQLIKPIGNYVEKILRDKNGQLVRATFCVYECAGSIKARLIKAELIDEVLSNKKVAVLTGFVKKELHDFVQHIGNIVSPYFSLNTLYFSGSKPRAPTI